MSTPSDERASACAQCGLSRWNELELVDRIAGERVREFVTNWSDSSVIEVRRCTCGRVLARMSPAPNVRADAP